MKKILIVLTLSLSFLSGFAQIDSATVTTSFTLKQGDWEFVYSYFRLDLDQHGPVKDSLEAVIRRTNPYPIQAADVTVQKVELGSILSFWIYARNERMPAFAYFNRIDAAVRALNIPYLTNRIDAFNTMEAAAINAEKLRNRKRILGQRN